jgi:hypothetical protein
LHPVLFSTTLQGWGEAHARLMREFATQANAFCWRCCATVSIRKVSGGRVKSRRATGLPLLDYPLDAT